jgi:hypothetical protein
LRLLGAGRSGPPAGRNQTDQYRITVYAMNHGLLLSIT